MATDHADLFSWAKRAYRNRLSRTWAAKNRGKSRTIKKKWRDANKAKQSQLTIAWQQKNRDKVNKQARERYAANLELSRAKLKAKRIKMGEKYRATIKRNRTKMRATTEGMLNHRMSQSVREALKGAKRRCKWETLLGYSVAQLRTHLESQFTDEMTWEKFFGGEIHIDHILSRVHFKFDSPNDEAFKSCWTLSNLRPLWSRPNIVAGVRLRWQRAKEKARCTSAVHMMP